MPSASDLNRCAPLEEESRSPSLRYTRPFGPTSEHICALWRRLRSVSRLLLSKAESPQQAHPDWYRCHTSRQLASSHSRQRRPEKACHFEFRQASKRRLGSGNRASQLDLTGRLVVLESR